MFTRILPRAMRTIVLILCIGVTSLAYAAPETEQVDALIGQPVTIILQSGQRLDGALYQRSEGHVVFQRNDGHIQSLALKNIARITLYQPPTNEDLADQSSDADSADSQATTSDGELVSEAEVLEPAQSSPELESTDADALETKTEVVTTAASPKENAPSSTYDDEPRFNALERHALEEELQALKYKQALKKDVDRTSRGLVIGGATVIGMHVVFQGLLLIPMFSDGGMAPRTARILSGVNVPFVLMGGSLLAAGLVQRHRAQQEFQERYNFSVAPTFHRGGGGAQFGMTF